MIDWGPVQGTSSLSLSDSQDQLQLPCRLKQDKIIDNAWI